MPKLEVEATSNAAKYNCVVGESFQRMMAGFKPDSSSKQCISQNGTAGCCALLNMPNIYGSLCLFTLSHFCLFMFVQLMMNWIKFNFNLLNSYSVKTPIMSHMVLR